MRRADDHRYPLHEEDCVRVEAPPSEVFSYLDDPAHLSAHMSERSWMMGGGRMDIRTDDGLGRRVGSHVMLTGRVLGLLLHVEGVVTDHEPPHLKAWATVGEPRLLVIGAYRMGLELTPTGNGPSILRIFIDYALPSRGLPRLIGRLFAPVYARWCTRQMARDAERHFHTRHERAVPMPRLDSSPLRASTQSRS